MNIRFGLDTVELERYRRVFAAIPELEASIGNEARVDVDGQHRPLTILPRPAAGSDPDKAARHLATSVPKRSVGLVVAGSIPHRERDALEAAGLSWCDGRGAMHLSWPGTLIHIDHTPRRRALTELAATEEPTLGPAGIRAVQAIVSSNEVNWTISRLAEQADISAGQAHNVFAAMERNRLAHQVGKGPKQRRLIDDRRAVLDWLATIDGARRRPPAAATYIYARTEKEIAQRFAQRASEAGVDYAVTAAAAANVLGVPVLSRIVVTQIRVKDLEPAEALVRLGLEHLEADEAGRGMNVEVWSDIGSVGTHGSVEVGDVRIAPPVRIWLDLLRQGGRSRDAAQLFREQTLERT